MHARAPDRYVHGLGRGRVCRLLLLRPARGRHADGGDVNAPEEHVLQSIEARRRAQPRLTDAKVTTAHGAGGKAQEALLTSLILEAYGSEQLRLQDDGAVVDVARSARLVFTTDSFVVTPRVFPGGSLGRLAVFGTVNDLAVMGAEPKWLAVSFLLEEGFDMDELRGLAEDIAAASREVGVEIVTGDTKVVERGKGDGVYVNTSGIGILADSVALGADQVRPGDKVIVSGPIGDHGTSVMLARGELALEGDVRSDCAPLADIVASLLAAVPHTRWMRDPTRGGLASACCELAAASGLALRLHEDRIAVRPAVRAACELLGLDPLYVANEGTLVAVVPADAADVAVSTLAAYDIGRDAAVVGTIDTDPGGLVLLETAFGGTRVVDRLVGDPLPRIC
ncbi:MAG: hydrogenase expression/formation protein HypE [Anaerolineales bacterium]|nr:hydrogenase expression/formation protein HypE [Anaerolineales bacterium]